MELIRIVIDTLAGALAVGGSGAYLRWAVGPALIAYEIGKIIGGRRYARQAAARGRISLSAIR